MNQEYVLAGFKHELSKHAEGEEPAFPTIVPSAIPGRSGRPADYKHYTNVIQDLGPAAPMSSKVTAATGLNNEMAQKLNKGIGTDYFAGSSRGSGDRGVTGLVNNVTGTAQFGGWLGNGITKLPVINKIPGIGGGGVGKWISGAANKVIPAVAAPYAARAIPAISAAVNAENAVGTIFPNSPNWVRHGAGLANAGIAIADRTNIYGNSQMAGNIVDNLVGDRIADWSTGAVTSNKDVLDQSNRSENARQEVMEQTRSGQFDPARYNMLKAVNPSWYGDVLQEYPAMRPHLQNLVKKYTPGYEEYGGAPVVADNTPSN